MPVTSRPLNSTRPASGTRCPVIKLNSVVFPAPFGPMIALIAPWATLKLTPPIAWKPSKLFRRSRASSIGAPADGPLSEGDRGARQSPREHEQQEDQDDPEDQGPVLRVRDDLLVEPDEDQRAERRAIERAHAAEQRHDQDLGGLGPVGEVREDAAVEDAEQAARDAGEGAGEDEGGQLVAAHVDADELGALGILADRREEAPERRPDDPA